MLESIETQEIIFTPERNDHEKQGKNKAISFYQKFCCPQQKMNEAKKSKQETDRWNLLIDLFILLPNYLILSNIRQALEIKSILQHQMLGDVPTKQK